MLAVVDAARPPLRLPLGESALNRIRGKLKALTQELDAWQELGLATSFPPGT